MKRIRVAGLLWAALARKEGVAVSIYILDNDGNHVYMHRMDGQGYLNIVTAEMKARTLCTGHSSTGTMR